MAPSSSSDIVKGRDVGGGVGELLWGKGVGWGVKGGRGVLVEREW